MFGKNLSILSPGALVSDFEMIKPFDFHKKQMSYWFEGEVAHCRLAETYRLVISVSQPACGLIYGIDKKAVPFGYKSTPSFAEAIKAYGIDRDGMFSATFVGEGIDSRNTPWNFRADQMVQVRFDIIPGFRIEIFDKSDTLLYEKDLISTFSSALDQGVLAVLSCDPQTCDEFAAKVLQEKQKGIF